MPFRDHKTTGEGAVTTGDVDTAPSPENLFGASSPNLELALTPLLSRHPE